MKRFVITYFWLALICLLLFEDVKNNWAGILIYYEFRRERMFFGFRRYNTNENKSLSFENPNFNPNIFIFIPYYRTAPILHTWNIFITNICTKGMLKRGWHKTLNILFTRNLFTNFLLHYSKFFPQTQLHIPQTNPSPRCNFSVTRIKSPSNRTIKIRTRLFSKKKRLSQHAARVRKGVACGATRYARARATVYFPADVNCAPAAVRPDMRRARHDRRGGD